MILGGVIFAGTISNNSVPSPTDSPYSLENIYDKLTDPNYDTNPVHDLFPSVTTDTATMHSLKDIFTAIPDHKQLDNSTTTLVAGIYATTTLTDVEGNLKPENIASGTVMFGVTGTYDCAP